jgi:large subunit ribosomal protein L7/L12
MHGLQNTMISIRCAIAGWNKTLIWQQSLLLRCQRCNNSVNIAIRSCCYTIKNRSKNTISGISNVRYQQQSRRRWSLITVPKINNVRQIVANPLLQNASLFVDSELRRYTRTLSSAVATTTVTEGTPTDATKGDSSKNTNNEMPPILWTTHRLNQDQIKKVDAIFHKILWLDLFESSMLNEIINERMGIVFNNKQKKQLTQLMENRAQEAIGNFSSGSNNKNETAEEEVAGPVLVDIKLASFDAASKIKVIKEVRSILSLGLKEAKEMVESAPVTLQKGIKQELADELKAKLESVGAKIEIS